MSGPRKNGSSDSKESVDESNVPLEGENIDLSLSSSALIVRKVSDDSSLPQKALRPKDAPIEEMSLKDKERLSSLTSKAYIPGLSVASIDKGQIQTSALGIADVTSKTPVNSDTIFWACSLSKPVFSYLVIKLITDSELSKDFLDKPLPWDEKQLGPQGDKKPLTARMILSHQTGLPNEGPPEFKFKPGEGFRYSGVGFSYLQKVIEDQTKQTLEELAQAKLFGPLGMSNSSFLFPEEKLNRTKTHDEAMAPNPLPKVAGNNKNAAASLHTTAIDYARFLLACLNDKMFLEIMQPQVLSMEKDVDAIDKKLDKTTLQSIDWGLGFGLQKNTKGEPIAAFHWGHGPGARTFFSIRLGSSPSAFVYLTNSENGLAIAEDIASPIVGDISPIIKFLSDKYGYEKISTPHWKYYHESLLAANQAEKKGNFTSAISHYQEALKLKPENKEIEHRIEWTKATMQIHKNKPTIPSEKLKELEGQYGPLKILAGESKMQINDGTKTQDLTTVSHNTFLDEKMNVILTFNRNKTTGELSLQCHFPNGGKHTFSFIPSTPESVNTKTIKK